jgi:hypothetical protein
MFLESHLTSPHEPTRIAACYTAYVRGFEVDEICELTELPVERVLEAIFSTQKGSG